MPYVGNMNTTFTTLTSSDANITDDLTVTDDASVGGDLAITGATTLTGEITANNGTINIGQHSSSPYTAAVLNLSGNPATIKNSRNGENLDIKTTSGGSLVHAVKIHSNGAVEFLEAPYVKAPLQPAFSVNKNDTAQSNFAAAASEVTVTFSAARFDQNSDFDLSNNRFVAPVTGKYQLNLMMRLENIDSASSYYVIRVTTSNRAYEHLIDPDFGQDNVYHPVTVAVLADMDANDTATIFISQGSGTAQTDISGNPGYTNFTGFLAC